MYVIRNIKTQENHECDSKGLFEAFQEAAKQFRWGKVHDYVASGNDVYTLLAHTTRPGDGNVMGRVWVAKRPAN